MRKLQHLFTTALVALTLLFVSNAGFAQGFEDFTNSTATASYADGSFVGNDGITWDFYHSRDDGGFPIDGNGLMLRRASDSKLESETITGGIGNFSLKMRKAFTGTAERQLELYINGDLKGTSQIIGPTEPDPTVYTFEVNDINVGGNFIIMIKNVGSTTTNRQVVIDDITWTGYIDTDPPVPTFSPVDAAIDVPINVNPTITFDEPIFISPGVAVDNTNVESLIAFTDGVAPVAFSATIAGNVITVVPTAELLNEQAYTLGIAPVQDEAGNAMAAPASATFTTISAAAETIELTGTYTGPYYAGEDVTVTWTAANIDNVVIEAWVPSANEGEGAWEVVVATTPAVDGTATFTIPADAEYSSAYKLRVADVVDGIPSAESAAFKVREVHTALSTLNTRPTNTEARFDGSAIVTYSRTARHQKYIQDDNAAILIDDSPGVITEEYPIGSKMTGLVGKINIYSDLVQFVPLEDPGAPVSLDNPVVPFTTTLADLTSADQSKLIKLENITFTSTGTFASGQNYDIQDNSEGTGKFRTAFSESDYIGEEIPSQNIVEMLTLVGQHFATIQLTSRSTADWVMLSDDATLATFTLGGENALGLTGLVVADPDADEGATMFVDDFTDFVGITATTTVATSTVEVKLNNAVVAEGDLATQALADDDVIVAAVTAEDNTVVYYKVTLNGENRELTLTAPVGVNSYNTGDDIVFTWTSTNITNVNLYAVDAAKAEYLINEEPILATLGTYTYTVPNGDFGAYHFRIADAADATFYYETTETSTLIDTQTPLATNSYPLIGATDMPTSFTLMVEFDEDVQLATGSLTIHKVTGNTLVQTLNATDGTVIDNVVTGDITELDWNTEYYINITAGLIEDLSGNQFPAITDQSWKFTTIAQPASDLFFSEYIEGSSNNKALEIYNPTSQAVNLGDYVIKSANNGSGWGSLSSGPDTRYVLPLTGTLGAGEVLVLANAASDPIVLAIADHTYAYDNVANGSNGNNVLAFNGDDAVGLFKNDVLIDVIGIPTEDPGTNWPVAGTGATSEYTLVRKASVIAGNTNWAASAGTNADDSEWEVQPQNTFTFLGWHGFNNEAEILSFGVDEQMAAAIIDPVAATITLEVLNGTDLATLVPEFTLSTGATATANAVEQESGVSVVDFTNPVVYTVEAESGITKDWTVTITEAAVSTQAEILSFSLVEQIGPATINSGTGTIDITVAPGTEVTALVPTIEVSLGATISPLSDVAQDFTNAVVYTVTAQDGTTTKAWTVTVTISSIIPIYDIQFTPAPSGESPYKDQVVTTKGIVTAKHYNYEGGVFKGLFIQDGEGAWNGLYVFNEFMENIPNVGDEIIISGMIQEYYTLTELTTASGTVPMTITVLSTDNELPAPTVLTTVEAAKEPWEGVLISVKNAEYTVAADSYNVFGVNDGSGVVYVDDDMYDYAGVFEMGKRYDITGIGHFSFDYAKILPRFASDVELVSSVGTVWGESISAYPNPFTNTLTIDNIENANRVVIVNLIGQQVMSINLNGVNRKEISTSELATGVYLVTIVNNQGQKAVRKMIKR